VSYSSRCPQDSTKARAAEDPGSGSSTKDDTELDPKTQPDLETNSYRFVVTRFGPYEITVIISEAGKYRGIAEVKLTRDYLIEAYRLSTQGFLDIPDQEDD